MAKKRKAAKKKTTRQRSAKKPEIKKLEVASDVDMMRGRYANHIQVSAQQEEFVLDFFSRGGEQVTLVSRIFISPQHGKRLQELLRRQISTHKKTFGTGSAR